MHGRAFAALQVQVRVTLRKRAGWLTDGGHSFFFVHAFVWLLAGVLAVANHFQSYAGVAHHAWTCVCGIVRSIVCRTEKNGQGG
jgi:hypothetical protein